MVTPKNKKGATMESFINVSVDINGLVTLRLESSTSDKVFNQLTVNSAVGEVRHIIESRYAGQLVPFGNLIGS